MVPITFIASDYCILYIGLFKLSRVKLVHTAVLCYKIAYLFIEIVFELNLKIVPCYILYPMIKGIFYVPC